MSDIEEFNAAVQVYYQTPPAQIPAAASQLSEDYEALWTDAGSAQEQEDLSLIFARAALNTVGHVKKQKYVEHMEALAEGAEAQFAALQKIDPEFLMQPAIGEFLQNEALQLRGKAKRSTDTQVGARVDAVADRVGDLLAITRTAQRAATPQKPAYKKPQRFTL